jgi:arabinose-5-phosphate isomerase
MALSSPNAHLAEDNDFAQQKRIQRAIQVIEAEADTLKRTAFAIGVEFCRAVDSILEMKGSLIVTGMGKAGLIGKKLAATFASTGTPSHFVHPAEAIHGDLGRFSSGDVVLALSNSGETEELVRILPMIRRQASGLIALTGNPTSALANAADHVLLIHNGGEACNLNLAPTSSTTAMLALGDALALVISENRGFTEADFAKYHPGGAIGLRLLIVDDAMRPVEQCRVANCGDTVRKVFSQHVPGRRTGAVMLVDEAGVLRGIFTDSDLARMMERRQEAQLDQPIREVMTTRFTAISCGAKMEDAIEVLAHRKFSELPVVDDESHPVGLIDVTDVMELMNSGIGSRKELNFRALAAKSTGKEPPVSIRLFS